MMKRFNSKSVLVAIVALIIMAGASSCTKDVLHPNDNLTADQMAAGRLSGTWATPSGIVTPQGVPPEVFGSMRLVFTTQGPGTPLNFMAQGAPIVFTGATAGTWSVTATADSARVKLKGITPVDDFNVKVTSKTLMLSFFMGWENTDTKATGKGNFKVILNRQ